MTPAEAIERAADALDLAHHDATPDALDALHRALLALAGVFEVTSPPALATVATWYALDAAAAARNAARREEAIAEGPGAPVPHAPRLQPLTAAEPAVLTARAALEVATSGPGATLNRSGRPTGVE